MKAQAWISLIQTDWLCSHLSCSHQDRLHVWLNKIALELAYLLRQQSLKGLWPQCGWKNPAEASFLDYLD